MITPLSDRLATSGCFRASDPGRFGGVGEGIIEDVSDIAKIARRESNAGAAGLHERSQKLSKRNGNQEDGLGDEQNMQNHLGQEDNG